MKDKLRSISIWEPGTREGRCYFRRPKATPLGDHYSACEGFFQEHESSVQRICFFGESVAAGYLYAPHITPAQILEYQLNTVAGKRAYEVIDLARTNERLPTLLHTFERAMQLTPAVCVLFMGNNWNLLETPESSAFAPEIESRKQFGAGLRAGGVEGCMEKVARRLMNKVSDAYTQIAQLAGKHQIQLVNVVPAVNLADWESLQPPAGLAGEALSSWHEYFLVAEEAMTQEKWVDARAAAMAMLTLDGGTCSTTFRLLAQAWLGVGQREKAMEAARAEVDAAQYANLCFLDAPRAGSLAQNMQRRLAQLHGFQLVDLPELFSEHTGTGFFGRRLFLDYCHLTIEGMRLSMAAIAQRLLRPSQTGEQAGWRTILATAPGPVLSQSAEALACLGAALHTAHRENAVSSKGKHERLVYWCRKALQASPAIHKTMLHYVDARTARVPVVLTEAQAHNLADPYRLLHQHGWRYDHLDGQSLTAIREVLATDEEAVERFDFLLISRQAIGRLATDLADPFYLWEPLQRFFPEVMPFEGLTKIAYHRSPWPFSQFCLVANDNRPIRLTITARIPGASGDSYPLAICLNGKSVAAIAFTGSWSKRILNLQKKSLNRGLNLITVCWPVLPAANHFSINRTIKRLEQGLDANLFPIFGEIFSLSAQTY